SVIKVLNLASLMAIFSIRGRSDNISVTRSADNFPFPSKMACVFLLLRCSSTVSIIPKKEVSAVFGMYENTVFWYHYQLPLKLLASKNDLIFFVPDRFLHHFLLKS